MRLFRIYSLCLFISFFSLNSFGQNPVNAANENVQKQTRIDSLLALGQNMFTAAKPIIFKSKPAISSYAQRINQNDLIIILGKENEEYYKAEWDNKIGYIFQFDVTPYDIMSEDHYISDNPLDNIDQSVRLDEEIQITEPKPVIPEVKNTGQGEISPEKKAIISPQPESASNPETEITYPHPERTEDLQLITASSTDQICTVQFFASKFANKDFTFLMDLGNIISYTDPIDKLTRYRIRSTYPLSSCEGIIQSLVSRGFPGSYLVE